MAIKIKCSTINPGLAKLDFGKPSHGVQRWGLFWNLLWRKLALCTKWCPEQYRICYFCGKSSPDDERCCLCVQVVEMTRVIEVSHWGNIAIEESFHVKHVGAELKVIVVLMLVTVLYVGVLGCSPWRAAPPWPSMPCHFHASFCPAWNLYPWNCGNHLKTHLTH